MGMPDPVLPAPSYSGNARPKSQCAVPAPTLPWGDIKIDYSKLTSVQQVRAKKAVRQAVQDIYYAMMMLEWMDTRDEAAQNKAWSKGPFGVQSASLKAFFGEYNQEKVEPLRLRLQKMFEVFTQDNFLKVGSAGALAYDPRRRTLAITPTIYGPDLLAAFGAQQVEEAVATGVGIRMPKLYAAFLRRRMDAADTCLASKAQV